MDTKLKFTTYLKMIVRSLWRDGKLADGDNIPVGRSNPEVKTLIKLLVELIMQTDYFKPETKAVLQGVSYRNSGDVSVNKSTAASRVNYDFSRLTKILGEDFFENLNKQDFDVSAYTSKITQLIAEYSKKSILDTVAIKLPKGSGREIKSIEMKDWNFMFALIKNYSKPYMHRIEKKVTEEMIDYIEFLENHPDSLNAEQQEHYESLQKLMG